MKRKLITALINWKEKADRKPLILEGARQVGKTYLIETEFGPKFFDNVVKINFENQSTRPIAELFQRSFSPKDLIPAIEAMLGVSITPGRTLLFFDEIQAVPEVISSLRYFYEEAPEYHVIAAGSLLGVYISSVEGVSYPVGRVETLRLEPMDFEEFIWAGGREDLPELVSGDPTSPLLDTVLADFMQQYQIVGGMPAAVASWFKDSDYAAVAAIQSGIITDYRNDFSKYTDRALTTRISEIFDSLPEQFAKEGNKFRYGVVKEGARGREYEMAVEWLVNSGIVRRVYRVERGDRYPLKGYRMLDSFKLYFLDVGLFRALSEIDPGAILAQNAIFNEYNGVFAEQLVLQNLVNQGYTPCYWASDRAEVDFLIQDQSHQRIVPIEVKSGENLQAKSLRSFRDRYSPTISIRLSARPYELNNGLLNLPLYKIFTIRQTLNDM